MKLTCAWCQKILHSNAKNWHYAHRSFHSEECRDEWIEYQDRINGRKDDHDNHAVEGITEPDHIGRYNE